MAINHTVKFRVNKVQLDQIRYNAKVNGYSTYSEYLRELSLRGDRFIENKVVEISKDVKEILRKVS